MRSLSLALTLCLLASIGWAEPIVEHLDPPSLARGKKNRLTAVGVGIDRAKDLWTSLPAGKLKVKPLSSEATKSEFEVEVAADCPVGLYGLRLATEDGLSNLQLFVVEEILPQAALKDPQAKFPVSVSGVFRAETADRYRIAVKEGQKLSFDVVASRLGTDADPLLAIYDAEGRRIAEHDNSPGLFFDCSLEHTFAAAGAYTVEVRDARFQGSPDWRYLLRIGNFPVSAVLLPSAVRPGEKAALVLSRQPGESLTLDVPRDQPLSSFYHAIRRANDTSASWVPLLASPLASVTEVEPNDTPEQATPVTSTPVLLHGAFETAGDKDFFAIDLKKGQRVTLRGETRALHSAADLELILHDPTGKEIARVDDVNLPGGGLDEGTLGASAGVDGRFRLLVRDVSRSGGPGFGYRIEIQPSQPRMQITSEVSAIALPQNSYQVLPLTVTRTDFTGPIVLSLIGAPAGVKLEPMVIPDGEASVICRLSTAAGAPLGLHTLGIAAAAQAGESTLSARVTFQPLVDKQVVNVDLIKHALRDNQRWLPASVTNRLALQITPPIPLAVDLPESVVVLPRYLQVALPVATTRSDAFEGDITFHAQGGQVGEESQGRRQVFVRYPVAKPGQATVALTFHSRSQANDTKDRIDVTATARVGTRRVELKRSFIMAVKPAFELAVETPNPLVLMPGGSGKIKLLVNRLPEFQGPVTVNPTFPPGVTFPEEIKIAAGQASVDVDVAVATDYKPGRARIRLPSFGQVAEYQEEPRTIEFELDVKAPPMPAKK